MTQINIRGQLFGTSGYASHTRNLANALNKLIKTRITTSLPPNWEKETTDAELEMIKRQPQEDEVNLIIDLPHRWRLHTEKRNWAYCVWEGDKVPECWIDEFMNPDIELIFVPSKHTLKAILNTSKAPKKKLRLIPHGVDLSKFYPTEKPRGYNVFLANKGFRHKEDRGGIQYLIQAFQEEFKPGEALLIVKINPAYGVPPVAVSHPDVRIIADAMPYDKLVELYNQANIFVSPTRSESFNIPCIEAMACGLPVITTNFGGQTDFCNKKNGWIIGGEMTEVQHEVAYEGIKWLTPSIKELKKAMRLAYDNPFTLQDKANEALKTAQKYTWEQSAKEVIKCLGQTRKQSKPSKRSVTSTKSKRSSKRARTKGSTRGSTRKTSKKSTRSKK